MMTWSTVDALDALNGRLLWRYDTGGDTVDSSPAVVGPPGGQVVAFGTLGGAVDVVSLASGAPLYSYQTGSFISASPADSDGNLVIDSGDGFLYDFGLGGGNATAPTTTVTAPANGSTVAYPSGPLSVTGTATAPHGVKAVTVEVQEGGTSGPWYEAATNSFTPGLGSADATLGSPGATSSTWSLTVPVPEQGASFLVKASSVDEDGIEDISSGTGHDVPSVAGFTVSASPTAPVVTPADEWIAPGGQLTVSAAGFSPGELVAFTLPVTGGASAVLGTATADSSGSAGPVTSTVPSNEPFGHQTITATGDTSGRVGAALITIANSSPQLGYGPQRQGFEDNDSVISSHQAVGASFFTQAWAVSAGSAISSPAVVDGVAYFGDGAGNVVALNATTGSSAWPQSPALGSGITSSPAVSGGVVFIVSSAGELDALNESNGAVMWSTSLGAASSSSPSVDPTSGVVVVADQSGTIHAFSTSKGHEQWQYVTGGPVVASPTLDNGLVLVGSENSTFYAVDESGVNAGKLVWSYLTGGPITSTAVITSGGDVGVGSGDGSIYNLSARTGNLDTLQPIGGSIDGLTGTIGISIAATSGGLSLVRGVGGTRVDWNFDKSDTFSSPVVILNGEVFAAGNDGVLRAFVIPGNSVY